MPLPEQLQGKLKEKASDNISDLTLRQMVCGRKAMQLEKKLAKMQNDYSNTIIWIQMLEHLLEEESNTKDAESDKDFYKLWQSKAKERLPVCCPTEQIKLTLKIHLLKTEEEFIAKILKGEFNV